MKHILLILLLSLLGSCSWKHDKKVVCDEDGNLYILKSNGVSNESYILEKIPNTDSFKTSKNGKNTSETPN